MAFVEFVEHDRADAGQLRIALDQARENAFGDDFDARACGYPGLEADAVADSFADSFAELRRHEFGGSTGGDAARFQHQDFSAVQPRCGEQGQRHLGSLAGSRWSFQHQACAAIEQCRKLRQDFGDGELVGFIQGRRSNENNAAQCAADARRWRID